MILNTPKAAGDQIELSEDAESALYQIAQNLGLIVTQEEFDALKGLDGTPIGRLLGEAGEEEALTEAPNVVKLNRQAKLDSLVVRSALVIAQQKRDPTFQKYAKASEIRRRLRAAIVSKYQSQAQTAARRLLSNAGRRNLVDVSGHERNRMHGHGGVAKPRAAR